MILSVLTIQTETLADSEGVASELMRLAKVIGSHAKHGNDVEVFVFDDPKGQILTLLRQLVDGQVPSPNGR